MKPNYTIDEIKIPFSKSGFGIIRIRPTNEGNKEKVIKVVK